MYRALFTLNTLVQVIHLMFIEDDDTDKLIDYTVGCVIVEQSWNIVAQN